MKGGCEDEYLKYRNKQMNFPEDYSMLTGNGWVTLSRVRPDLVSNEQFQLNLREYYKNSKDDEKTKRILKKLIIEKE